MCRAYDVTSEIFDEIIKNEIILEKKRLSYGDILNKIREKAGENFSYRYSPRSSIKGRLVFLESNGYLKRDENDRFYKDENILKKRRRAFYKKRINDTKKISA